MRADGVSFAEIASRLGVSLQWAYKCASDVVVAAKERSDTIVKHFTNNGGCSTQSNPIAIRLPRIPTLHGAA
jgi:hypothetical protein